MKPTNQQIKNGTYKYIITGSSPGMWYKKCTGPAHEEPEYLPAIEKYFHFHKSGENNGKPVARCRLCVNWSKTGSPGSYHGFVPARIAQKFYLEATNRIGLAELSKRTGISRNALANVIAGKRNNVQKAKLRKVMLELTSIQRKGEFSIDKRAERHAQRRMHQGHETCSECGTPKTNYTANCGSCYDRLYGQFKNGKLPKQEWQAIREQLRLSS